MALVALQRTSHYLQLYLESYFKELQCVCTHACVHTYMCRCGCVYELIYCAVSHPSSLTTHPVVNQLSTIHSIRVFSQESKRSKSVSHQVLVVFDSGLSLSMTSCLTYDPKRYLRHASWVHLSCSKA